jgi:hypothetical protein
MKTIKWAFELLALLVVSLFAGTPGIITGDVTYMGYSSNESNNSMASIYDIKKWNRGVDTGVAVIATQWTAPSGFHWVLEGITNNSATFTEVRVTTANSPTPAAADTIRLRIPAYASVSKLQSVAKIFKGGSTDSLLLRVQLTK